MAEDKKEQRLAPEMSLTARPELELGVTGALASVQRSLQLQERILAPFRRVELATLASQQRTLAKVMRGFEVLPGIQAAAEAAGRVERATRESITPFTSPGVIKGLSSVVDQSALLHASSMSRAAAMTAQVEIPRLEAHFAASRVMIDHGRVLGMMRGLDESALIMARQHKSLVTSIGERVTSSMAAMARQEVMRSSALTHAIELGRLHSANSVVAEALKLRSAWDVMRPSEAAFAKGHLETVARSIGRTAWLGQEIVDALAIAASTAELEQEAEYLDQEKARLGEVIERAQVGLILPPGASTLREPEEVAVLLNLLGRSPYNWIKSSGGLLVALTKSYITYGSTRFATADELATVVARDPRLHDFVATNLASYRPERLEGFRGGTKFYVDGVLSIAIPTLNHHLEGVLLDVAINAGYLMPDPKGKGKTRFKDTGKPIGGVEDAINVLHEEGVLSDEEAEYLRRDVYGGRGNPYRHGIPDNYDLIQAARIIWGFYIVTERTREIL